MEIYILADNQIFSPNLKTKWTKVTGISIEDAIKLHCGKKTFQLHWEDSDGMLNSITFPTFEDTSNLAQHLAHQIFDELKKKFT